MGNQPGVPKRVQDLRNGYPAIYVTGLWPKYVTPPLLPGLVQDLGAPYGGYWIWGTAAFWTRELNDLATQVGAIG